MNVSEIHRQWLNEWERCRQACETCIAGCYAEGNVEMARCIILCMDCIDDCKMIEHCFAKDQWPVSGLRDYWAQQCGRCADECERFSDRQFCRLCAGACRRYAAVCQSRTLASGTCFTVAST